MRVRNLVRGAVVATILAVLAALLAGTSVAAPSGGSQRYLVVARSGADYGALRAKAVREGARVLRDIPQLKTLVSGGRRARAAASPPTAGRWAWPATTWPASPPTSRRPPPT
jgi:hypothetical protein